MSVLEKFFQISLLLTVMVLGVNVFVASFGYALTGENLLEETQSYLSGGASTSAGNVVQQQIEEITVPQPDVTDWNNTWTQTLTLVAGCQLLLNKIFVDLGLPVFGIAFASIITVFQAVGASYIVWALISAWKGGGSP